MTRVVTQRPFDGSFQRNGHFDLYTVEDSKHTDIIESTAGSITLSKQSYPSLWQERQEGYCIFPVCVWGLECLEGEDRVRK